MTVEEAIKKLQELPPKAVLYEYDAEWNCYDEVDSFNLIKLERPSSDKLKLQEADPSWPEKRLNGKKIVDAVVINY